MIAMLSPRFWIGLALVTALAFTHGFAYKSGRAAVRNLWDAEKLATSETSRLREQAAQKSNERIDRENQIAKDRLAADKRLTDDSLRDFKAALGANPAPSASSGNHGTGGLERELLGNCATTVAELAITADRLEAKVVGLQSYITNVCQAK